MKNPVRIDYQPLTGFMGAQNRSSQMETNGRVWKRVQVVANLTICYILGYYKYNHVKNGVISIHNNAVDFA